MKKVFLYLIAGLVCMTGITGCGDENNAEDNGVSVPLTDITVDPPSLTILANSKQKLTATPVPADATDVWFEWSSSDPSVATVYSDGTVFVKKYAPGTTTVTVKSGSVEVQIPVSVQEVPLEKITVDVEDVVRMPVPGSTLQVKTKLEPANATGVELVWRSENPNVATVDSTGTITAMADGTTNISVSFGAVKKTFEVSVGLEDIIVEDAVTMYSVTQIIATSVPPTDYPIPYIWRSENPDVATVDDGWVTPVSSGTATITVSYGSVTKSVQVNVPSKFPKEGLSVVAWSDAYTGGGGDAGGVAALFDNNYGSPNWHSGRGGDYNASSFPYWFVVDMGSPKTVTKIVTQFQGSNRTARMRCYISNSNSIATQGTGNSAIPNPEACAAWGTKISDTEEWNDVIGTVNMLSNATAGRYLLLYLYEPGPGDGDHHTNIFEIDIWGY